MEHEGEIEVMRSWDESCCIGGCKDRLSALVLYGVDQQEWEKEVQWLNNVIKFHEERFGVKVGREGWGRDRGRRWRER